MSGTGNDDVDAMAAVLGKGRPTAPPSLDEQAEAEAEALIRGVPMGVSKAEERKNPLPLVIAGVTLVLAAGIGGVAAVRALGPQECPTGTVREVSDDPAGGRRVICDLDDGRVAERVFREDGTLATSKTLKEGVLDGPYLETFDTGEPKLEGGYLGGKKHGAWTTYRSPGHPLELVTYLTDKREGLGKRWHDNGHIAALGTYVDDEELEPWEYWTPEGELIARKQGDVDYTLNVNIEAIRFGGRPLSWWSSALQASQGTDAPRYALLVKRLQAAGLTLSDDGREARMGRELRRAYARRLQ